MMGRFKGNAIHYHSIGQNIMIVSKVYKYHNGRFGVSSPSTGNNTRNIYSLNPLITASDFYTKIAKGGIEKKINDNHRITRMADGTVISYRIKSISDGTPVVEINIRKSRNNSGVKSQKIHFVKE